ncbi:hypothetical protein ACS0TY_010183 [Phlomoides rotata]
MSRDNWERLVAAVVKREQIWQLCHAPSRSPSISTISSDTDSDFSGPILSFQDLSVSLPSPVLRTDPSSFPQEINEALERAAIFRYECAEVGKHVERLWQMLRSVNDIAVSSSFYDRPFILIATEVSRCLQKSLTLVKKCRHNNLLIRVVTRVSTQDFRKLVYLLDSSTADMKWLLSIYEAGGAHGGIVLTLPPIASNDPMISWVWSFISSLYMGQLQDKIEAANELALLAKDNDRNKQIIVEEGGISPLVKLLKDGSSTEAQIAAAAALSTLANDAERVRAIVDEIEVPSIVIVLRGSPMKVQIRVANLVAKMAEHCPLALEDFGRVLIRSLLKLLSFELLMDDPELIYGNQSTHSVVQTEKNNDMEDEKPEEKVGLKISCAKALWMLAKGSVPNCRRITETEGLLCLAKLVETEEGDLQYYCVMTIMEITAALESNDDFSKAKCSSVAKAAVDQLLRVIKDCDDPRLRIAAIRAIGSLARAFPARETRVLGSLVEQLSHGNQDVAIEAAVSLGKFANPENFLCVEHSKSIIGFKGVPPLMRLLRGDEKAHLHGFILICYLAIHAGKSDDLERAGVVNAFAGVDRVFVAQHPQLKELIAPALYHLTSVCR